MLSELVQPLPNQCRCVVALVYLKCSAVAQPVVDSPAHFFAISIFIHSIALEPLGAEETVDFEDVCDMRSQPRRVFIGNVGLDDEVDLVDYRAANIRSTTHAASNGIRSS